MSVNFSFYDVDTIPSLKDTETRATMMSMDMAEVMALLIYQAIQCNQLGRPIIFINSYSIN